MPLFLPVVAEPPPCNLPRARSVVVGGPYHYIRHPLHLAETISIVGVLIAFFSVAAVVLFGVRLFCQVRRMNYEEKILRDTFPEYRAYLRRSARLLPGVY